MAIGPGDIMPPKNPGGEKVETKQTPSGKLPKVEDGNCESLAKERANFDTAENMHGGTDCIKHNV